MEEIKLLRKFSKDVHSPKEIINQYRDFSVYSKALYKDLLCIEKFYHDDFNSKNQTPIEDYINLFNSLYDEFIKTIINKDAFDEVKNKSYYLNNPVNWNRNGRYLKYEIKEPNLNFDIFKEYKIGEFYAFNDNEYNKLNDIAKKIFMIEKICASTTKKYWDILKQGNTNKNFSYIVKSIMPVGWRNEKNNLENLNYYKNRIATSSSFINERKSMFFHMDDTDVCGYIFDADEKAIIAGFAADAYLEEKIDGKNPLVHQTVFSEVSKLAEMDSHEIYGYATETTTPFSVIMQKTTTNEIILNKNYIKPKAVFYLGKKSINFAKELAEKDNLPLVKLKIIDKIKDEELI